MKNIKLINGNGKSFEQEIPTIVILGLFNDIAKKHLEENTKINFAVDNNLMIGKPYNWSQIAALFLTYDFKTMYCNNATHKNTLFLKSFNSFSEADF